MALAGVPTWSTTAASNGTADPAVNFAEGQAPSSVNDSARGLMASVAKWRDDLSGSTSGLTTGGTSTAYTVSTNATFDTAAHMSGMIFTIIPHATNGTSPTLAVDGLTARALNFSTGVAVSPGSLQLGTPYPVKYVHATTEFIVLGAVISGAALTAPAIDDEYPIYDLSATTQKRITLSDALKVINLLTADATPDSAADFVVSYDASASGPKKVLLGNLPSALPRDHIAGCTLSNGTDTVNDLNIAAGKCRDSTDTVDITVPALTGKQLDANWAAGSAAGMRNSAVGIADGTYHIYAFRTAASATADIYAHTSATLATALAALQAETGGSAYAYGRHIGSIVRATTILQFTQRDDVFTLSTLTRDVDDGTDHTTAKSGTLVSCPSGIVVRAQLTVGASSQSSGAGEGVYVSELTQTNQAPPATTSSTAPGFTVDAAQSNTLYNWREIERFTSTAQQIRYRASTSSVDTVIIVRGYVHPRGRTW